MHHPDTETAAYSAPPAEGGQVSPTTTTTDFATTIPTTSANALILCVVAAADQMDRDGETLAQQQKMRTALRMIARLYGIPVKGK